MLQARSREALERPLAAWRPRVAVYEDVRRRIVLNELKPGDVLTELGLARELACSQGTVREALLRLQEEGLVTRAGHRGTTVTALDPDEAAEILAVRRRIETRGALRLREPPGDARLKLDELQGSMEVAAGEGDEYRLIGLDTQFHLAVFRLSGLQALEQILLRCTLHTHRSKLWAPGNRRPLLETARRHRPLTELVAAGDGPGLAEALAEHIDSIVELGPDRTA